MMKKLYMKQQIFSGIDRFTVKNAFEQDVYLVEGDHVQVGGKKLHIKDMTDRETAMIQQKLLSLKPKFFVFKDGVEVAKIVKKFAWFGTKYVIEGPGWEVKGDIMGHDYSITSGNREIVHLHKVWLSWGDSYELDISDAADEILVVAVVLAIDCVLAEEARTSSESN